MTSFENTWHSSPDACVTCTPRRLGLCGLLDSTSLAVLSVRSQHVRYKSGDEIALQGERSDRIGIISTGLVRVVLMTEDGEHHLLQLLKPGQIVGDPYRPENAFSWEAVISTEICWINRQTLEKLMHDHPQVHQAYLSVIARQLEDHRLWAAAMRGRNTLQRTAFWVVQQLSPVAEGSAEIIQIELSRRDLASLLDMTVETLCRSLHQLADRDAIALLAPDEIKVLNPTKLRFFARCGERRASEVLNSRADGKENPFCISRPPKRSHPLPKTANSRQNDLSGTGMRCV